MNCFITLDYELNMGESGTPECCLFEPMKHLTAMLDKYGIKTSPFVDAAYLLQLRKYKDKFPQVQRDYDAVTAHIKKLDEEGHAIQLHLHPQWCYSIFDGEKWVLDKAHYKLSDMPLDEQKRLIHEGTELLNSLITKKVTAFRAGGYSVENFPEIFDTLLENGIIYDSSVLRGDFYKSSYQSYDYRKIPNKTSYSFQNSNKKEVEAGRMKEYPISVKMTPYFIYAIQRLLLKRSSVKKLRRTLWADGKGIGYPGGKRFMIKTNLQKIFKLKTIAAYIESGYYLDEVYEYVVNHYEGDEFVILGHPKGLSPYAIELLEIFIKSHLGLNYKVFS